MPTIFRQQCDAWANLSQQRGWLRHHLPDATNSREEIAALLGAISSAANPIAIIDSCSGKTNTHAARASHIRLSITFVPHSLVVVRAE
ncbi:hypothetical protein ACQR1Y_11390 [Bradyrhizobium sp. HKCCYLRH3099]|uniref:hypothetical protein n=1 Tax=unclassified Bradyrhizobium TaxID=2631580 RepID=UPI003EC14559